MQADRNRPITARRPRIDGIGAGVRLEEGEGQREPATFPARGVRIAGPGKLVLAIALALAGVAGGVDAEDEAPPPPETWYASAIAQNETDFQVTHYWSKGDRFRAETVMGGRRIVTIVNGSTYFTIDPVSGFGIGIERSDLARGADATRRRPFGDEYDVITGSGGELVSRVELGGQSVELYRLTNSAGRVQVWVTPNSKLPVRVERIRRGSAEKEEINYVNWLAGIEIADSFFEPPPNLQMRRVGYEDYVLRATTERMGPAPPLYAQLLHGEPE